MFLGKLSAKCTVALVASLMLATGGLSSIAQAQSYPQKPITVIVPFSPGGGNDILLRLVAKYIKPILGQSLTVENRPGASGQIGWTTLSKSRNDGYTLGATSLPSMILVKSLRKNVPFSLNDFTYICNFQVDPIVWVVKKDGKFADTKAVLEYAKANPKKLNVAGDGPQSNIQLQHLVATKMLDVQTNFVSYSGSGPSITALLGDKVDMAVSTLSAALSHIEGGRIMPIVLFYDKSMPVISGTPTAKEAFGQDIPSIGMALRGVAAPKGLPADKVAVLEKAFKQLAESEEFLQQAKALGLSINFMGSQDSTNLVKNSAALVEEYKSLF